MNPPARMVHDPVPSYIIIIIIPQWQIPVPVEGSINLPQMRSYNNQSGEHVAISSHGTR